MLVLTLKPYSLGTLIILSRLFILSVVEILKKSELLENVYSGLELVKVCRAFMNQSVVLNITCCLCIKEHYVAQCLIQRNVKSVPW